jgi:hypothetical protein
MEEPFQGFHLRPRRLTPKPPLRQAERGSCGCGSQPLDTTQRKGSSYKCGIEFRICKRVGKALRIIVEEVWDVSVIVTLYKTSRIGKYLPDSAAGEDR